MQKVRYTVTGAYGTSASAISAALLTLPGVTNVRVCFPHAIVEIVSEEPLEETAVRNAMASAGYRVRPAG